MKIFWTKQSLIDHDHDVAIRDRAKFMQATASNAAKNALHYYICFRSFDWWREKLDEAEKAGDKYMSLAEMFTKVREENEKIK